MSSLSEEVGILQQFLLYILSSFVLMLSSIIIVIPGFTWMMLEPIWTSKPPTQHTCYMFELLEFLLHLLCSLLSWAQMLRGLAITRVKGIWKDLRAWAVDKAIIAQHEPRVIRPGKQLQRFKRPPNYRWGDLPPVPPGFNMANGTFTTEPDAVPQPAPQPTRQPEHQRPSVPDHTGNSARSPPRRRTGPSVTNQHHGLGRRGWRCLDPRPNQILPFESRGVYNQTSLRPVINTTPAQQQQQQQATEKAAQQAQAALKLQQEYDLWQYGQRCREMAAWGVQQPFEMPAQQTSSQQPSIQQTPPQQSAIQPDAKPGSQQTLTAPVAVASFPFNSSNLQITPAAPTPITPVQQAPPQTQAPVPSASQAPIIQPPPPTSAPVSSSQQPTVDGGSNTRRLTRSQLKATGRKMEPPPLDPDEGRFYVDHIPTFQDRKYVVEYYSKLNRKEKQWVEKLIKRFHPETTAASAASSTSSVFQLSKLNPLCQAKVAKYIMDREGFMMTKDPYDTAMSVKDQTLLALVIANLTNDAIVPNQSQGPLKAFLPKVSGNARWINAWEYLVSSDFKIADRYELWNLIAKDSNVMNSWFTAMGSGGKTPNTAGQAAIRVVAKAIKDKPTVVAGGLSKKQLNDLQFSS